MKFWSLIKNLLSREIGELIVRRAEIIAPFVLIVVSIGLMVFFGVTATERKLTDVEAIVFQILSLFSALIGSYIFGRQTSKELIKETIQPHARSAFRRLISLYKSISRVAAIIESSDYGDDANKVAIINAIVTEQIATADDALGDWQDVVPEAVEELLKNMNDTEQKGDIK